MSHQEADSALGYTSCSVAYKTHKIVLACPFRAGEVYARVDSGIGSSYQKGGGAATGSAAETE